MVIYVKEQVNSNLHLLGIWRGGMKLNYQMVRAVGSIYEIALQFSKSQFSEIETAALLQAGQSSGIMT